MFLYLNSGNGHIAQATVLKEAMEKECPGIKILLVNGFKKSNILGRFCFETFYAFACNYLHGAYPLVYDCTQPHIMQAIIVFFISLTTKHYLKKLIDENEITDVVSFHFALTPTVHEITRKMKRKVNIFVFNTDPFTAHKSWCFNNSLMQFVGSDKLREYEIKECNYVPSRIKTVPHLVNSKYKTPATKEEIIELRKKFGFEQDKKIVLLAGGGEGLPGTLKIVNQWILKKGNFTVAVVCGRNRSLKHSLELLKIADPKLDLHIYGFVDYMDSLIKLSDLVVSKAGTSSIMEILSSKKPLIINSYIHNQELGNMQFVVKNHVGFYIRHSHDIYKKINELFSDDAKYSKVISRFETFRLDTDASKIVRLIVENNSGE